MSGTLDPLEIKIQRPMYWEVLKFLVAEGPSSVKQIVEGLGPVEGVSEVRQPAVSYALSYLQEAGMVAMEVRREKYPLHYYQVVSVEPIEALIDKLLGVVVAAKGEKKPKRGKKTVAA